MKKAAKVFIIIGLVCSILVAVFGWNAQRVENMTGGLYTGYGIYALVTSIGSLCAITGKSKKAVIVWGILYIPVMFIASIFMFLTPKDQLN